ncbi:MAG: hypothetical protein ACKO6K_04405, partial [Chitinophagaceae bacterium]
MKLLRNSLLILLLLIVSIAGYVQIATLNQAHMTFRQKILKVFYPLVMALGRSSENGKITMGPSVQPPVSFYSLSGQLIDDTSYSFSQCAGKMVLIVNTASDCGYTQQYAALQQLFEQNGGHLVILAFPSNEFKRQERYSNGAIAEFCKKNYG